MSTEVKTGIKGGCAYRGIHRNTGGHVSTRGYIGVQGNIRIQKDK